MAAKETSESRFEQPLNTLSPMEATPVPMVIEAKLVQPLKALSPIEVTLLGMIIEVRLLQPLNALSPIAETPVPTVSEVNLLQAHLQAIRHCKSIPIFLYSFFNLL